MFKEFKFHKKLENEDIEKMSEKELKMKVVQEMISRVNREIYSKLEDDKVYQFRDTLLREYKNEKNKRIREKYDLNWFFKKFHPATYPFVAMGMALAIFIGVNSVNKEMSEYEQFKSTLIAYEESLNSFESDICYLEELNDMDYYQELIDNLNYNE